MVRESATTLRRTHTHAHTHTPVNDEFLGRNVRGNADGTVFHPRSHFQNSTVVANDPPQLVVERVLVVLWLAHDYDNAQHANSEMVL